MEVNQRSHVSIVGLGYGNGGQVTRSGHAALTASGWIGHFGLPSTLKNFICSYRVRIVDLDEILNSRVSPEEFCPRAIDIIVRASALFGRAAVAVSGHPMLGSPFASHLASRAVSNKILFRSFGAPSAFDNYSELSKEDLLHYGTLVIDVRAFLRTRKRIFTSAVSLMLFNAASVEARYRAYVADILCATYGEDWDLQLFVSGDVASGCNSVCRFRLGEAAKWWSAVRWDTTVFVPRRRSGGPA